MNFKNIIVITTAILLAFSTYKSVNNATQAESLASPTIVEIFQKWSQVHGRNYATSEEQNFRINVFLKNYLEVTRVNALNLKYKLGLNKFSDMTEEEIETKYMGFIASDRPKDFAQIEVNDVPASIDWRTQGKVGPVKDQGHCGSCWAFSAVASIETAMAQATGTLALFSEQQLVDCSRLYGNKGCNGGLMDKAFDYVKSKGLTTEDNYPYVAKDETCKSDRVAKKVAHIKGHKDVNHNDSDQLQAAAALRVISVAIQANEIVKYSGGIFNNKNCGTQLNHGVAVVGYGTENGTDFWIVRNSWGATWGEAGYIRMERTDKRGAGMCGIAMQPSYPIV